MFKIIFTPKFAKQYKKLPQEIKEKLKQIEHILRNNPFDVSLRTHKLTGNLKECWGCSITYKYRLVFTFDGPKIIVILTVGTHSIYDTLLK